MQKKKKTLTHRIWSLTLVLLLFGIGDCSHFRYGTISWEQQGGARTARFKVDQAWRRDFGFSPCGSACNVGAQASTGSLVFPSGAPSSAAVTLAITAVDLSLNYFTGTFTASAAFSGNGPFQVSFYTCCRLGGIVNAPAELATTTKVLFPADRTNRSPVTNVAPIMRMMARRRNSFLLPVSDADLDPVKFTRVAIGNGAGTVNSLTVDAETGQVVWDTGTSPTGYYTIVIRMEDFDRRSCQPPVALCASGSVLSDVMVDFFIQVVPFDASANDPVIETPVSGETLSCDRGQTATFAVTATDRDAGQTVTLVPAWSVPGMAFTGVVQVVGRTTATFSWPVPSAGASPINQACFIARDSALFESPLTCVTIKVGVLFAGAVLSFPALETTVTLVPGAPATVVVVGANMSGGSAYACSWRLQGAGGATPLTSAGTYVDPTHVTCAVPAELASAPGTYVVEASKDGTGFTTDRRTIAVVAACPNPAAGPVCSGHGTCAAATGLCTCSTGFKGLACEELNVNCGDGARQGSELCDDGNLTAGDGCSVTCGVEARWSCVMGSPDRCFECGNGLREGAEACDDGGLADGDGCSAACTTEAHWACTAGTPDRCVRCGNGVREGPENCDDGGLADGDGCAVVCAVEAGWVCTERLNAPDICQRCGDGAIQGDEACDDLNAVGGDGCSAACSAVESGWSCSAASPSVCQRCGDGVRQGTETCDDANAAENDGCSSTCAIEAGWSCMGKVCFRCGNGLKEGTETCDDGNRVDLDGCSATCAIEFGWSCLGVACVRCGNGVREGTERCDDGNLTDQDGCSSTCGFESAFAPAPANCSALSPPSSSSSATPAPPAPTANATSPPVTNATSAQPALVPATPTPTAPSPNATANLSTLQQFDGGVTNGSNIALSNLDGTDTRSSCRSRCTFWLCILPWLLVFLLILLHALLFLKRSQTSGAKSISIKAEEEQRPAAAFSEPESSTSIPPAPIPIPVIAPKSALPVLASKKTKLRPLPAAPPAEVPPHVVVPAVPVVTRKALPARLPKIG